MQLDDVATHEALIDAQRKIATILCKLEKTTGRQFESLSVRSIEVTNCGDRYQRFLRRVEIELRPVCNSQWDC